VLITWGQKPSEIAISATVQLNEPWPWPMSKITPRSLASQTTGSIRRVAGSTIVEGKPWKQCV